MGASLQPREQRRRRTHRPMSEINVTPFVDVMLVLLVVFMVTAPFLTAGVSVDLPDETAGALSNQDNAPVEITIDRNGKIFMGKTEVSIRKLRTTTAAIAQKDVERRVYIRADKGLSYGEVMQVMSIVNQSGFRKVALITDTE